MTRSIGAMAAVLMPAGLFDFARGSSLAGRDKVISDFDAEAVRGQFQQIRAQTLKHTYLPSGPAGTTTTTGQLGGYETRPGVAGITHTLLSKTVQASAHINNRELQESACGDGATSISVSSTVFPLMEGCLSPVVVDGIVAYTTEVAAIFPFSSSSTDPPIWVARYTDPATGDATSVCFSLESADDVDPSEATWYCDTSGNFDDFILADGELSVSCGCSTLVCADGDSFSIVSDGIPDGDGCYLNTEEIFNENIVYTTSGGADSGQIFVIAIEEDTSATARIVWLLALLVNDDSSQDGDVYCWSLVEAALYHPSEVPEWTCVEGVNIDVTCGCSSSASPGLTPPTPTPVSPGTPTPVAPPTPTSVSPTMSAPVASPTTRSAPSPTASPAAGEGAGAIVNACPGDGSFTITANANPELSGCFIGSTLSDGSLVYTVSGTTSLSEIVIFAVETDDGDLTWVIAYIDISDSDESQPYCTSVEPAIEVTPGDASWICDFTGDYSNLLLATEDDISIVCGSCGTFVGTPQPTASQVPPPTPTPVSQRAPTPVSTPIAPTTAEPSSSPAPSPAAGEGAGAIVNACPGDGSFTITANANPELSGCFIGSTLSDGSLVYTVSGTTSLSEIVIFAVETDDGDLTWVIAYIDISDSDESQPYCTSVEPAIEVTPGDASWICDFTGDYINVLLATENDISIVCGSCGTFAGTPEPTASRVPPPTPTPVSQRAPTPASPPVTPTAAEPTSTPAPSPASVDGSPLFADTCSGDGSFTITANAAPNLDGCYKDTFELLAEGTVLYSRSGEATESEVIVFSYNTDDGEFNWFIGFIDLDGVKESQLFCSSVESASDVNPGNASWYCDFTGNGENLQLSSEEDMSIVCGSCTEVAPEGASPDASPASTLGVGVIAAGGAGMVSVASVLADWF